MAWHWVGDLFVAGLSFWTGWLANQWWAGRLVVEPTSKPIGDTTGLPTEAPTVEPVNPMPGRNWCLLYGADGTLHSVRTMADDPPPYFERHHGKGNLRRYVLDSHDDERFVYRLKS